VSDLLLRRASIAPGHVIDLLVRDGRIAETAHAAGDVEVVDVGERPTLPGLVDHHIHLFALAASWTSIDCSPAALAAGGGLAATLRAARTRIGGGWLRGIGYDMVASGTIDRTDLDRADIGPVRIQDRTGILWVLDSKGLGLVLEDGEEVATGVIRRGDRWLRDRLGDDPPDLRQVGDWLAQRGVTAVTDAGASNTEDDVAALRSAGLPQRVTVMTGSPSPPADGVGPVKLVLDGDRLPELAELQAAVTGAHAVGRGVAVHAVDPESVVLALAAGLGRGDRIEHGTHVPDDVLPMLADAGVTVVVQPGLVETRGDRYLAEVPAGEHRELHRLRSFVEAGVRIAGSSDAPFGPADPWQHIAAATQRLTSAGVPFGPRESLPAVEALHLYTGRQLDVGAPADLVVLDATWGDLADSPAIAMTMVGGTTVFGGLR
jgi:predicted amidohydrolase YtcJ